jgi:Rps23 Pro-64 3,4-dihydroxylase Tpa1-like proline 4-hydroxylase
MLSLQLNPKVDPERYAQAYAERRCVRIPDFFDEASAAALETVIAGLPWRILLQDATTKNVVLTREEFTKLSPEKRREFDEGMRRRAAEGVGHLYLVYPMIEAAVQGYDPGHPIHELTEFLNSRPMIEFARALIRLPAVSKVDAHASCFLPGHYLNRHVDDGLIKERKAAYTINFSREWRPDWGGMLLIYDEDDDVRIGLRPRFNTLTVFDGLVPHSVTAIAPFAPKPRYTIAGWFRDDPPYRRGHE